VSGQVQVMLVQGGGTIAQHVKSGKLTALAVSTASRSKFYPDLPSIAETLPGFESESWVAMFAPAATPKAVIEELHASLRKQLGSADVRARLEAQNCDIVGGTPEALTGLVKKEQAKWGRIINAKHITVD
jgi:tripartite-type tricarboxylate transporter receptor subunit TctC